MATFDPFSEVQNFANQVLSGRNGLEQMPMDLYRQGANYYLAADLPGIDPTSVDVDVDGQLLTIRAQRRLPSAEKDTKWIVRERRSHSFVRQLNLGQGIDTENITAAYDNGVLTVTIPVSPKSQPRKIQVATGQERHDNVVLEHDKGSDEDRSQNEQKDSEGSQD
ncbi:Hsp20 family protein [Kocuria indica]|uniref:Hsp20 family protein n=1 Tax=Kocuria marina subsp. indica TaxID=1049583 RepID=A0A6N9R175_9MICC|nr:MULTISPECIES: Hsp20/alpha crystallin family protein [Kocuria]MCT1616807.1 Hsp20/alpha crystallin family protein [Kocuria marina]NDO78667.1 Hsp20 family protein [Kocuria indica]